MFHKMFVRTRQLAFSALIVLCLLASSMPAMAQDSTVTSPTGDLLSEVADAPTGGQIAEADLAADQSHQNKVAFANSLTADQRNAFANILAKYKPQLDALIQSSTPGQVNPGDEQIFMPSVIGLDGLANATARETPSAQSLSASAQMASIQSSINDELGALLNAEQQALFAKLALAKSPQVSASAADAPQGSNDCYYAAVYGSYSAYWTYYAELYSYYDYYYYGNGWAYYNWYYNWYAKYNAYLGLLYAGGAWARVWYQGTGDWDDTAFSYWDNAEYYSYWGRYYAYYSYYYYSSYYAYYSYYYADYANYYAYYAWYYSYYCS